MLPLLQRAPALSATLANSVLRTRPTDDPHELTPTRHRRRLPPRTNLQAEVIYPSETTAPPNTPLLDSTLISLWLLFLLAVHTPLPPNALTPSLSLTPTLQVAPCHSSRTLRRSLDRRTTSAVNPPVLTFLPPHLSMHLWRDMLALVLSTLSRQRRHPLSLSHMGRRRHPLSELGSNFLL
jgi:hypothetical protein